MTHAPAIRHATLAALLALLGATAWADGVHRMTLAKDLKWNDVPSLPAGAKAAVIEGPMNEAKPFIVRLRFPADYRLPAHVHPAAEHVTVLSGTFYMGMGDKLDPAQATMALGPGDVMVMEPNTRHFALTREETVLQLHGTGPWGITYVNPADDPRNASK